MLSECRTTLMEWTIKAKSGCLIEHVSLHKFETGSSHCSLKTSFRNDQLWEGNERKISAE